MAGQSVLNELILEPAPYNEGPSLRDWQNWPTKISFNHVGVLFHMYFTITGMKNIVQQQHYLTMTIPDLSLLFTFFSFVQKGEGEEGRE